VIERLRLDLERGLKRSALGRSGLTPAQVLRSLDLDAGEVLGLSRAARKPESKATHILSQNKAT
jgi:hypothetical protein